MAEPIKMRCRTCKRTKKGKRESYTPPEAIIEEVECPDCSPGSWCEVKWFDKDGREIDLPASAH